MEINQEKMLLNHADDYWEFHLANEKQINKQMKRPGENASQSCG
jgi:hypothetical protein